MSVMAEQSDASDHDDRDPTISDHNSVPDVIDHEEEVNGTSSQAKVCQQIHRS